MQEYWVYRVDLSPYQGRDFPASERELINRLNGFHYLERLPTTDDGPGVLITNTNTHFDQLIESPLVQSRKVSLIIHPNSGYDNIPAAWVAQESTPPIIIGNPIRQAAVTEYIVSALCSHFTKITPRSSWDHQRRWKRPLLKEKRLLIIGFGHIGSALAEVVRPLVKEVTIYDPYKGHPNLSIPAADIVALCAGLNPTSKQLVDRHFLAQLPSNYLLINGARGGLVDEDALFNSLKNNPDAHAFLDVFATEPLPSSHPFYQLTNITLSSHIAGVYQGLDDSILEFEASSLNEFYRLKGEGNSLKKSFANLLLQSRLQEDFLI